MMKSKQIVIFVLLTVLVFSGLAYSFWRSKNMNEVDQYKPYSFVQKKLSNGLDVLLVKEEGLPYISFDMMFKAGSKVDPKEKEGLMYLLTEIIDKGTKTRPAMQVAEDIETLGADFFSQLGYDSLSFSVQTLSHLNKELLEIFSEIITKPAFLEQEFQRAKKKALGYAKRSAENFSFYAGRTFNKYLYDPHPYGFYQYGRLKSLEAIQLKDIKSFYDRYFRPGRALLSVSGRYPEDIIQQLEKAFGHWKGAAVPVTDEQKPLDSATPNLTKTELLIVDQASAVQSEIRMGHISLKRSHPDYLPLRTANVVLGGSFTSRLMSRIRTQKGLTYGISSYFSSKKELGAFKLGLAVRNEKVGSALLEIIGVLENFNQKGITEEELEKAKQLLKNQFITHVSTADSFAHYLMYLNSQGIPYSYAGRYFKELSLLDLDKVNMAIKQHLRPHQIKILVLTSAEEVKSQLKDFEPFVIKNYKSFL